MTQVKICKTCATENVPSDIECAKCMGDISGVRPVDKEKADAEKARADFLHDLHKLATKVNENGVTALMVAVHHGELPEELALLLAAGADINAQAADGRTPLIIAITCKNDHAIKALIDAGVDLEVPLGDSGLTPLMIAAGVNPNPEVVTALVKAGADIDANDKDGVTALMRAAENTNPEVVTALAKVGADIDARDAQGCTALMRAAERNTVPGVLTALVEAGAGIDARDAQGLTSLMRAAGKNINPEVVTALVKAGADIEARDPQGLTPLMYAANGNPNPETISALVKAGADIEARGNDGLTPLMYAADGNPNPEVITALVKAGADIDARDAQGLTALMRAAERNTVPGVLTALVEAGADIEARSAQGFTALMRAAERNTDPGVLTALIAADADIEARDPQGLTPLMRVAGRNPNPEVITALVKAGADIEAKDPQGLTPLMYAACMNPNPEVITVLVKAGADIDARDAQGFTAFMLAVEMDRPEAIRAVLMDAKRAIDYIAKNSPLKTTESCRGFEAVSEQDNVASAPEENNMHDSMKEKAQKDGHLTAQRCIQLWTLIEGNFLKQNIAYTSDMFDENLGENSWLFKPGIIFSVGSGGFILSLRGHITDSAHDIARWIEQDAGLQVKLSKNNDIIAYEVDTPADVINIINQVLSICDSAVLPLGMRQNTSAKATTELISTEDSQTTALLNASSAAAVVEEVHPEEKKLVLDEKSFQCTQKRTKQADFEAIKKERATVHRHVVIGIGSLLGLTLGFVIGGGFFALLGALAGGGAGKIIIDKKTRVMSD